MRSDMTQVLIERPRFGSRYKTPKGSRRKIQRNGYDTLPGKEPIRRCWQLTKREKDFSDLLGPLQRFLQSRVGCSWDEVYSEIRENISPSSKMQLHLLGHVMDLVELNPIMVDGIPHYPNMKKVYTVTSIPNGKFYVYPDTGILKQAKEKRVYPPLKPLLKWKWADQKKLQIYCQSPEGIWYLVQLEKIPYDKYRYFFTNGTSYYREWTSRDCYDVMLKKSVAWNDYEWIKTYGGKYYAKSKRQLNSEEIRKNNLRNF